MRCSIIIPVLNEAEGIIPFLSHLQKFRQAGHEVILVDGGSVDETCKRAQHNVDLLLETDSGRAQQMNIGAEAAKGDVLMFLHADTFLPDSAMQNIENAISVREKAWGHFSVQLSGKDFIFRIIESMMNIRSCLTGIATGDQAMFVGREFFIMTGGFDDIPLMEDVTISKTLKSYSRPACLRNKVRTSSRRWEQHGIIRTIFLMWSLRLRYWLGASPDVLVTHYYKKHS